MFWLKGNISRVTRQKKLSVFNFEKIIFQYFPHTDALGRKFDLAVKKSSHPRVTIWTNLVVLKLQMLNTKIQPQSFLGYEEEDF